MVMRMVGYNPTETELHEMISDIDVDGKSRLSQNIGSGRDKHASRSDTLREPDIQS